MLHVYVSYIHCIKYITVIMPLFACIEQIGVAAPQTAPVQFHLTWNGTKMCAHNFSDAKANLQQINNLPKEH